MSRKITWVLEDHLCRACGGRILRSVSGVGPTPGGNPVFRCADCGASACSMGAHEICWCGFHHRMNHTKTAYRCVPFSEIQARPQSSQKIINAFRACGCEPGRGEVGIMLERDYLEALKAAS